MIKVFIIDEQPIIRLGIRNLLNNKGIVVVGEAGNGFESLRLMANKQVDVVLLDFNLPDIPGLELVKRMRFVSPDLKFLFVTSMKHLPGLARLISSDINGIVMKESCSHCLEAVQNIYAGKHYIQPDIVLDIIRYVRKQTALDYLNDREYQVLLMSLRGQTYDEIASIFNVCTRTVVNVKSKAIKKLGVKDSDKLKRLVYYDIGSVDWSPNVLINDRKRNGYVVNGAHIRGF